MWSTWAGRVSYLTGYTDWYLSAFSTPSCVNRSYPIFFFFFWLEKESSGNDWHPCGLSRSCRSASYHMTPVPLTPARACWARIHRHVWRHSFLELWFGNVQSRFGKWHKSAEARAHGVDASCPQKRAVVFCFLIFLPLIYSRKSANCYLWAVTVLRDASPLRAFWRLMSLHDFNSKQKRPKLISDVFIMAGRLVPVVPVTACAKASLTSCACIL